MLQLLLALLLLATTLNAIPIDTLEKETRDDIPDAQIIVAFSSNKLERGYSNFKIPHQAESGNDIDGNNYGFFGSFNYYFGQHNGKEHGSGKVTSAVPWTSGTTASAASTETSYSWWWWETTSPSTTSSTPWWWWGTTSSTPSTSPWWWWTTSPSTASRSTSAAATTSRRRDATSTAGK